MELVKPSFVESVVLGFIALIILIIGAYEQLANWFFLVPDVQSGIETAISDRFEIFMDLIDEFSYSASIISALIWSLIGAFVFAIIWVIANVLTDLKNNLKVSAAFVHPNSFHQSTFWGAYLLRTLFKSSIVILLVAGGALWVTKLLPAIFTAIKVIIVDSDLLSKIVGLITIWLVLLLTMHLFIVFLRLLLGRNRLHGEIE